MDCRKVQQKVVFTITAGFLLMVIRSIIEKAPRLTIWLGLGFFAFTASMAILCFILKKPWITGIYKAVCLIVCLLFYPIYFVIYGGMAGGMVPFFMVGFYIISKLFYKTTRIIIQSLTGTLYTFTLLISHYWWRQDITLESEAAVSAHIWHFTVTGAMLIVMAAVHADSLRNACEIINKPVVIEKKPEFGVPADIKDKLLKCESTAALICFTVIDGDSIKQKAGFDGYDKAICGLKDFFLNLSEPGQTVVSYGGDSFVILLENVDSEFAEEYAGALIQEVKEIKFKEGISVIMKSCVHMTVPGESFDTSLKETEQALF